MLRSSLRPDQHDVVASRFPLWDEGDDLRHYLDLVYTHVVDRAQTFIDWYLEEKRTKKRWARRLRVTAIVLLTVGGVLPLVSQMSQNGSVRVDPAWATVVITVALAVVLLDRFFGFSTGWARFISAELSILRVLTDFQIDWQEALVRMGTGGDGSLAPDDAIALLDMAKEFNTQVDGIVEAETSTWVKEFQESLSRIEAAAEPRKVK